jgi:hypothetical protein
LGSIACRPGSFSIAFVAYAPPCPARLRVACIMAKLYRYQELQLTCFHLKLCWVLNLSHCGKWKHLPRSPSSYIPGDRGDWQQEYPLDRDQLLQELILILGEHNISWGLVVNFQRGVMTSMLNLFPSRRRTIWAYFQQRMLSKNPAGRLGFNLTMKRGCFLC